MISIMALARRTADAIAAEHAPSTGQASTRARYLEPIRSSTWQ